MKGSLLLSVTAAWFCLTEAWLAHPTTNRESRTTTTQGASLLPRPSTNRLSALSVSPRNHGEDACFMPLKQLDQDYFAPRIVQIAGAYPGLTRTELEAVTSTESPSPGQWTYDFSDPEGPQLGTVALEGSQILHDMEDPVVIIAEHFSIGVDLPKVITDPVDLVVLVDRADKSFSDRKFLVVEVPGTGLVIGAYPTKRDMPADAEILGRVGLVQVPWLPSMTPTKTGFMESDEYF